MGNRLIVTDDEPIEEGRLWLVNGSEFDVDFYLNYDPVAYVQGIEARSIGAVFRLKDSENRPYGEYTLEAREADKPNSPVLASASAQLAEKKGFEAVFYEKAPGEYEMAIFENDYSGCEDPRMEVRLCSLQEEVSWRLRPSNTADPRIAADVRTGTLRQGEFQVVDDITENDYFIETFVDGELSTFFSSVDSPTELNKYFPLYIFGDLPTFGVTSIEEYDETYIKPASVEPPVSVGTEGNWMQMHEIEVPVAPGVPDAIHPPQPAYSNVDRNKDVVFDFEPVSTFETNVVDSTIRATDPDGKVTGFKIESVEPPTDKFELLDNSFVRAADPGDTSTQKLRTLQDAVPGNYVVNLAANLESLMPVSRTQVPLEIKEIDFQRLIDLVDFYDANGGLSNKIADDMRRSHDKALTAYDDGKLEKACKTLEEFAKIAADAKGNGATEVVAKDFELETIRLQENINCG